VIHRWCVGCPGVVC